MQTERRRGMLNRIGVMGVVIVRQRHDRLDQAYIRRTRCRLLCRVLMMDGDGDRVGARPIVDISVAAKNAETAVLISNNLTTGNLGIRMVAPVNVRGVV